MFCSHILNFKNIGVIQFVILPLNRNMASNSDRSMNN
uniref:Uncharacterized protein n=1 Tax=Heterorhabditis bacteriophora TaxID=37862 RepID=A0A1I7WJU5_HETBA